ncbi:hypothetical protein ACFOEZ_10610 [Tianweitania populi]|nr:hypothetical protein [Tianweitania populi]
MELSRETGLSVAFISPCDAVFAAPQAAYTRKLIDAIPLPEPMPGWLDRTVA